MRGLGIGKAAEGDLSGSQNSSLRDVERGEKNILARLEPAPLAGPSCGQEFREVGQAAKLPVLPSWAFRTPALCREAT